MLNNNPYAAFRRAFGFVPVPFRPCFRTGEGNPHEHLFWGGDYRVDTLQSRELHHWLDSIPNLEKYEIHLISHTDPIGGRQYNEWLSQMRSETVKRLILQKQIPEHKISIKDWGLDNAVYSNRTRGGMRMNRRVDVILFPIVL